MEGQSRQEHPELEHSLVQDTRGRVQGIINPATQKEVLHAMIWAMEEELATLESSSEISTGGLDTPIEQPRGLWIKKD